MRDTALVPSAAAQPNARSSDAAHQTATRASQPPRKTAAHRRAAATGERACSSMIAASRARKRTAAPRRNAAITAAARSSTVVAAPLRMRTAAVRPPVASTRTAASTLRRVVHRVATRLAQLDRSVARRVRVVIAPAVVRRRSRAIAANPSTVTTQARAHSKTAAAWQLPMRTASAAPNARAPAHARQAPEHASPRISTIPHSDLPDRVGAISEIRARRRALRTRV